MPRAPLSPMMAGEAPRWHGITRMACGSQGRIAPLRRRVVTVAMQILQDRPTACVPTLVATILLVIFGSCRTCHFETIRGRISFVAAEDHMRGSVTLVSFTGVHGGKDMLLTCMR